MMIAQEVSTVKYVALLSALKITGAQERILARYLQEHLGNSFCPTQMAVALLTTGHANIHIDSKCRFIKAKKLRRRLNGGIWILTEQVLNDCQEN